MESDQVEDQADVSSLVVNIKKSYQRYGKAVLKDITEALIVAAQEQVPSGRAIKTVVYYSGQEPRCRNISLPSMDWGSSSLNGAQHQTWSKTTEDKDPD